ncbi:hypothetical protein B0H13DRAFT_1971706 [Mycena leptocephala]|nr:hypothetical protein B0H13DRAFT_1971706 [Mycena leptocephala]
MTQSFFTSSPTSHSPRSNLPRGKACMNCRYKCDGRKPVCSQCLRSPGTADDCEYPLEGRSRTQQLEETIKKLQTRIGELEATANESSILLHEPYDSGDISFMSLDIPQYMDSWTPSIDISTSRTQTNIIFTSPDFIYSIRVDAFLEDFTQVGFFLDPASFRHSALLALPFGHYDRPSPALLSAVYMWGSRLAPLPRHPMYNEDAFLVCTLQNIHQDLGSQHPHRVLHGIQAEVLLSLYYLTLGRPVEGIYHSSAAVSLAISAGLHLIQSSSQAHAQIQPAFGVLETPVRPPAHAREAGERISAFWTAVIVNNYWVAAHGAPAAIAYHDTRIEHQYAPSPSALSPNNEIDIDALSYATPNTTPTPGYRHLFAAFMSGDGVSGPGGTVARFLAGLDTNPNMHLGGDMNLNMNLNGELGGDGAGFSPLALLAKASILLERAITFSGRYSDHGDVAAFESLDVLLEHFVLNLPLGLRHPDGQAPNLERSLHLVTHTLAHAAIIRLHAHRIHTSDVSRRKYLSAARAVVHIVNDHCTEFASSRHVDPIMGILWTTASEVFLAELSSMQSSYGVVGRLTQTHQDLTNCLETLLATMRAFAPASPLIGGLLSIQETTFHACLMNPPRNKLDLALAPPSVNVY